MGIVPSTPRWSTTRPHDMVEYLIITFVGDKSFPLSSDFWHKLLELPLHLQWPLDRVCQACKAFDRSLVERHTFEYDNILFTGAFPILEVDSRQENKIEFASYESSELLGNEQEDNKPSPDKVQRRLAQNPKAARKSCLRKRFFISLCSTIRI